MYSTSKYPENELHLQIKILHKISTYALLGISVLGNQSSRGTNKKLFLNVSKMARPNLKFNETLFVLLSFFTFSFGNLIFSGCDKSGWTCTTSNQESDKYDLEYSCNNSRVSVSILLCFVY